MKIRFYKNSRRAFSLLEVMIAIGIFFIGSFAILTLVSQSLGNARRLQHPLVDASALLSQLSLTNQLTENEYSGSLEDMLGKNYAGYTWKGTITEVRSNKLFSADFYIFDNKNNQVPVARTSTFFYRPQSKPGSLDGGNFVH